MTTDALLLLATRLLSEAHPELEGHLGTNYLLSPWRWAVCGVARAMAGPHWASALTSISQLLIPLHWISYLAPERCLETTRVLILNKNKAWFLSREWGPPPVTSTFEGSQLGSFLHPDQRPG